MHRRRLPNRRAITTIEFEHDAKHYVASAAHFDDGGLAELFINTAGKAGSEVDTGVSDAAVSVSLALQHNCPADVIRHALKRNPDGTAMGPVAKALDLLAEPT
jgi:hypothetical protein